MLAWYMLLVCQFICLSVCPSEVGVH